MFTTFLLVLGVSVAAVALFMIGLGLRLIIKGRFMDNEISTNPNMRKLGIRCAVQESRVDQQGVECYDLNCRSNCAGCDIK